YHGGMGKPIDIYKKEAFGVFEQMVNTIDKEIVNLVYKLQVNIPEQSREERRKETAMTATHKDASNMGFAQNAVQTPDGSQTSSPMAQASQAGNQARTIKHDQPKVGRNDPCPCGSGKKYKKCHGKDD
ncbi:MAG: hypothetical protein DWP97_07260, partial [Calditrichaeota bacterium]